MMVEYDNLELIDEFMLFLPRNLSYTEEGYLDNFSSCSGYVKPKSPPPPPSCSPSNFLSLSRLNKALCQKMCDSTCQEYIADQVLSIKNGDADSDGTDTEVVENKTHLNEVPSEEGVFVNMMDEIESVESPESRDSSTSDPSYFSLDSPEEDPEVEERALKALSERVSSKLDKTSKVKMTESVENDDQQEQTGSPKSSPDVENVTKFATLKIDVGLGGSLNDLESHRYLLHAPESPVFDEPEFQVNKSELRKSSSLKTNKTPPGTPHRKKMVRFADVMGLDLESIRHVLDTDRPPKIPASAIADLKVGVEAERRDVGSRFLDLCFSQPGASDGFLDKVMGGKIALENCIITDLSITGIVRVANIGYHKIVRVRYSINNWVTFYDVMASYIQNSCDGPTDRFSFTIVAPANFGPGAKLSFAVSYTVNDMVYWDSNSGRNYEVVCYAKTTPTELEASWMHFV